MKDLLEKTACTAFGALLGYAFGEYKAGRSIKISNRFFTFETNPDAFEEVVDTVEEKIDDVQDEIEDAISSLND